MSCLLTLRGQCATPVGVLERWSNGDSCSGKLKKSGLEAVHYRGGKSCGECPVASFGHPLWAVVAAKTRKTVEKRYMILATQDVVVKAKRTRK